MIIMVSLQSWVFQFPLLHDEDRITVISSVMQLAVGCNLCGVFKCSLLAWDTASHVALCFSNASLMSLGPKMKH